MTHPAQRVIDSLNRQIQESLSLSFSETRQCSQISKPSLFAVHALLCIPSSFFFSPPSLQEQTCSVCAHMHLLFPLPSSQEHPPPSFPLPSSHQHARDVCALVWMRPRAVSVSPHTLLCMHLLVWVSIFLSTRGHAIWKLSMNDTKIISSCESSEYNGNWIL